ncbi:probable cytochrome P450 9h1 [Drosophila grimshawi]|uniref:GH20130 n=1 Tax=Drosophila grimshawi TaxID=7222 RepID=B4J6U1_DROGR|nr:probable cytochrome P450 9h1 [Drosophila grimshawi]EDW02022.1 GH20130 [Drosophila grimshawi]
MLLIVVTLVVILLGLLYKWSTSTYHKFEERGVPHEKPRPLLGNVRFGELMGSVSHLRRQLEEHVQFPKAKVYGMYFLRDPVFVVRDLELIRNIGVKEFDHFMNHHASDKFETIFSKSLVQLKNREWRAMRNILSPTFTGIKMRSMYELINACCEVSVEYIEKQLKQEGGNSIDLEMKEYCTRFTNDVIASAAFGIKINSFEEKDNRFYKIGQIMTNINFKAIVKSLLFTFLPWLMKILRVTLLDEKNIDFFRNLVSNAVNYRVEHKIIRPDMIQLLMEAQRKTNEAESGKKFTDDDFLAQCLLFFFAGFDTVSTCLCFLTYELCMNPEVQAQLYEEILSAEERLNGKPLDYDTLMHMKYLDMVVSESLRKWPPVTRTDRACNADIDLRDENDEIVVSLKKNDQIFIPILALHYDPEHFAEPEKFIPERFSDENKNDIKPSSYLPFGIGPRSCIGNRMALMEVKSLVYHLLTKFQLTPAEKTSKDMMGDILGFQMVPKNKFWVKYVPRQTDVKSS